MIYTTNFPLTENPMSEGGVWVNGGTNGLDWTNNRTTPGKTFGTQTGNNTNTAIGVTPSRYDDSVSVLNKAFLANQRASAVVFNTVASGDYATEVELLLRFQITAHTARGYEIEYSANPGNGYFDIVLWNGAVADFGVGHSQTALLHLAPGQTQPGAGMASRAVVTGDALEARIAGSTITAYVNGVLLATVTDSTWADGAPGIGHYLHNNTATADVTTYGFTSFFATDDNNPIVAHTRMVGVGSR